MQQPTSHKVCPNCQVATHLDAQFCANCGHQFQTQFTMPPNQTQAFYGYPHPGQYPYPYDRPDSNKLLITMLLWFFLGGFGAHRFYLGHTNSAVLMLVLQLVGIATACILVGYIFIVAVWIWWIVDLIQMLTGNLRPTDGSRLV
jgi:TM2 domain-containing membrane protein YozV